MNATQRSIKVHVVFVLGKKYVPIRVAPSSIGTMAGGAQVALLSFPWVEDAKENMWDVIESHQGAKAAGREIVVSSSWNDEPMLVLHFEKISADKKSACFDVANSLIRISDSSKSWGESVSYLIYGVKLNDEQDDSLSILNEISLKIEGEYRGEVFPQGGSTLKKNVAENALTRTLIENVIMEISSMGLFIEDDDVLEESVIKLMSDLKIRGLRLDAESGNACRVLARDIARRIIIG